MATTLNTDILKKLYAYCAYQDRCRQEIEAKLDGLEVDPDEWENWLAHLEAERFWDEERFVKSFVRGKFYHKSWGPIKIHQELRKRRIPEGMITRVMSREISDEELQAGLSNLIERKWREYSETNRDKLIRFLLQKGYSWDNFRHLLPQ